MGLRLHDGLGLEIDKTIAQPRRQLRAAASFPVFTADPAANTITDEQATDAEEAADLAAAIGAQQAELAANEAAEQAAEAAEQQDENTDDQQDGDVENQAGNIDQGHDEGGD